MEFIQVTAENLEREHICCAIASGRDCQVLSKKSWLAERFDEGLTFWKADARGKCFIEYIPGENAWAPVEAEGLMWIDCLWVSGQLAGHGYADELLERCFMDTRAQGRQGMAILASDKKRGFGQVCPRRPGGGGAARRPLSGCPPGERGAGQGESIALYRVQPVLAGGICDP